MAHIDSVPFQIKLYGRQGCHLCDDVEKRIRHVSAEFPLSLEVINVSSDPQLEEKYMFSIPVVEIDGDEAFVTINSVMTEDELRDELKRRSLDRKANR